MEIINWVITIIYMLIHFFVLLYSLKLEHEIGNELKDLESIKNKIGSVNAWLIVMFVFNLVCILLAI